MFWGHFLILGQWVDSVRGLQTSVQIIQRPSLHVLCRPNCAPLELSLALGWDSLWLPGHSAGWGCPIIATSLKFENAPVIDGSRKCHLGKSTGHFLMTYMTKTGFFRFQSKRHPANTLFPPTGLQQKRRNMKTFGRSQPRINTLLGCLIEGSQFNSNSNSCMMHLYPQIQILGLIEQWKTPVMQNRPAVDDLLICL
jgi:hypothetical protein